ncbi:hypothetical protein, conserved [Plasmodium gonderi]|uniref:Uncharacterized protein n=1 Tax=Plasmodium gonderi TaxID=77519 RepID=A0A1Y1JMN9_PLAGO|nr:hypothetical protein, conserved [Plasmodium gonderi]GAW83500.1 hypothetical protein, conserved [Plasmodium gonderi]
MEQEKKEHINAHLKKKCSEIEFYTPKSNLSHESLNRGSAFNNLHKYVNTNVTDHHLNIQKPHLNCSVPAVNKKNILLFKNKKESSILNYIKGYNNTKNIFVKNVDIESANRIGDTSANYKTTNKIKEKKKGLKKCKVSKKCIFSDSSTSILSYFKNVNTSKKRENSLTIQFAVEKNKQITVIDKMLRGDIYSVCRSPCYSEKCSDRYSEFLYNNKKILSEWDGGNGKMNKCEKCEENLSKEGKLKFEYLQNNIKYDHKYNDYLHNAYLYCKKYFLYSKMEFFSKCLFYRQKNIKNFIFLIEALFLQKKYIDLLCLLRKYKSLWVFCCKSAKKGIIGEKGDNARNIGKKGKKEMIRMNSFCDKNYTKFYPGINNKCMGFNENDQYSPSLFNRVKNNETFNDFYCTELSVVHKLKNKVSKNINSMCKTKLHYKYKSKHIYDITGSINSIRARKKMCKGKISKKMYCICYIAFIKILSLIKMNNQVCLNKCINFIKKINKKCLLNKNGHYLTQTVIQVYELKGLYNCALKYSMLLFLKCPLYPQIIRKLFSFSILCLKDEIHLILLAKYHKNISWIKYFFIFILYSVNYQFQCKKTLDNFLFLIEKVTRCKKKNVRKSVTKGGKTIIRKIIHNKCGLNGSSCLCCNMMDENIEEVHNTKSDNKNMEINFKKKKEYQNEELHINRINQICHVNHISKNTNERQWGDRREWGEEREHKEEWKKGKYFDHPSDLNYSCGNNLYNDRDNTNVNIYKKITLYNSSHNKVTLYDAYVYIAHNKFSSYFPKFFLYSKLYILINIKRSFYEKNFTMSYSLSKLLLTYHMYDSSVITFFVNSAYLLNKISCIKKLAQELKKNNQTIYFLFCNAALLLHFKQIERSIQIYKYIVDSYENIFSDLYFYSLFNLIYELQLTQKAHQIISLCKNFNKLFFNNIYSYILLSYYYLVNDLPIKCYTSLIKAYNLYHYHPDVYYILSLLALTVKKYEEYITFSELALFFSLKKQKLRNYIFSKIYEEQHKYVPFYLLNYNFEKMDSGGITKNVITNLSSLLNYVYFENLIKSYIILHFCSPKRRNLNYLILSKNLSIVALNFFSKDIRLLHSKE